MGSHGTISHVEATKVAYASLDRVGAFAGGVVTRVAL